ncbi:MAG: D-Ala-D-Ala carboxypeptidase family metallohydrolase, partial [Paraclostridium sp.]
MKISNFFSLKETTVSPKAEKIGMKNVYSNADLKIISYTAARLDAFRKVIGKPFTVNSWFRSKQVNDLVEGSKTSAHMKGLAVDIQCSSMTPMALYKAIQDTGLSFDQLIIYNT